MATLTAKTVNQALVDQAIRHAVWVERVKNGQAKSVQGFISSKVVPEVVRVIEARYGERMTVGSSRYAAMVQAVQASLSDTLDELGSRLDDEMVTLAEVQAAWQKDVIERSTPVSIRLATPERSVLRAGIVDAPVDGLVMEDWLEAIGVKAARNVQREVTKGMSEGLALSDVIARVREQGFKGTRAEAEAVTRSYASHAANHASQAVYEENSDVVKGWQYVAVLDNRTCPICAELDGLEFPLGEGPMPPRHLGNCRCRTVPVVKSWEELGFGPGAKEVESEGVRSSLDGQVAEKTTYGEWLRGQSDAVQNEVLGSPRAELFRSGELEISDFVNDGRVMTLEELRKKHKIKIPTDSKRSGR